jgi:hypothetical protein
MRISDATREEGPAPGAGGGFDKIDHPGIERRSVAATRKASSGSMGDPRQA